MAASTGVYVKFSADVADFLRGVEQIDNATAQSTTFQKKHADELDKLAESLGRVRASVDPAYAAELRFADAIAVANGALRAGLINEEQYADLADRLNSQIRGAGEAGKVAGRGIEEMSLQSVGARREIVVLAHEVLTGRFSRIPGSLMVLGERMGGVSLAAMGMAGAVAGVGVVVGELLIRQEALDQALDRATASLDNQGRVGAINRQMLAGYVGELDQLHGVSQAAAEQIVVDWSQIGSITPAIFQQLTQSIEGYIVLTGEKAPAAAKQLAQAIQDPIRGIDELAAHHVYLNEDAVQLIGTLEREGNVMQARQVEADALAQAMQKAADDGMTPLQKATTETWNALSRLGGAAGATESKSVTLTYAVRGLGEMIGWLRVPVMVVTKSFFDMLDVADLAFQGIKAGLDSVINLTAPLAASLNTMWKAAGDAVHGEFSTAAGDLLKFPDDLKARYQASGIAIHEVYRQMGADLKDMMSFTTNPPALPKPPTVAPPGSAGSSDQPAPAEQALRLSHILDRDLAKRREIADATRNEALIQARIAQLQHEMAGASEARRQQIAAELADNQAALKVEQQRKAAAEASEAKTDNGGVSRIAQWRGELAQRVADEATTRDQELRIAVQFWQQKLAGEKLNAQETEAIHTALARAQGALARATAAEGARAAKSQAEGEIRLTQAQLQQAEKGSEERIALARKEAAEVKRLYGERSAEYVRAEAQVTASQRAYIDRQMQTELQERQRGRDTALADIQDKQAALAEKARLGQIGATDEIAQLRTLENQKYALEVQGVQDQLKLEDLTVAQKTALYTKLEQLARQHHQALLKLNQQQVQDNQRTWQQFSQPVISAFDTSVKGIVMGTQTIQQAVGNIAKAIVSEFVDMGVKMLTNWLVTQLEIVTGSEATALSNIGANAAVAASAAFASTAAIPMVGPELAPAAAAAAYGQTMAWGAAVSIPSAAGGYDVPADTLAQIHRNEVVLPRHLADRFRAGADAINGGGGFSPTIHFAANGRLTAAELAAHADTLVAVLKQAHRNGAFAGARA